MFQWESLLAGLDRGGVQEKPSGQSSSSVGKAEEWEATIKLCHEGSSFTYLLSQPIRDHQNMSFIRHSTAMLYIKNNYSFFEAQKIWNTIEERNEHWNKQRLIL